MNKANFVTLAVTGALRSFNEMHEGEQKVVKLVHELRDASEMIGAEPVCGAIVFTRDGSKYGAAGNTDSHAVITALEDARSAGANSIASVVISVPDNRVHAPLPEDALAALAEFGEVTVLLVGDDRSVLIGTVKASAVA
ncbi:MAG: hypothetical protein JST44_16190 [Cyanobacteria bacterium SZAS LIN-5]|nr:hypothetical protein [Cyanobacteria bacterium SZAS LIN-5]RTL43223.1 MAG: hypothetical protein EKK48_10040 [Candidatus Melainabacteria bacterium]